MREKIQKKLINHKFIKPLDKLADKKAKFALKVYNDCYSKKERELMAQCPKGWLSNDSDICVNFGSQYTRLNFNGLVSRYNCHRQIMASGTRRERIYKIVPITNSNKIYETSHKLYNEFTDLEREEDDLHEEIHKAMAQSKAALWSVNTLKQLLEVWPEIEEFIPEYALRQDTSTKKNLPALPIDDLNASFGLKKKEAA